MTHPSENVPAAPPALPPVEWLVTAIPTDRYDARVPGHVLYDPKTRAVLDRMPFFRGSVQAYAVRVSRTGVPTAMTLLGPLGVPDPTTGAPIEFEVECAVWIDPRNAADVVKICADPAPGLRLRAWLEQLSLEVVAAAPTMLDEADPECTDPLALRLAHRARHAGLEVRAEIRPRSKPIALPPIELTVSTALADYPRPVDVRVKVTRSVLARDVRRANEAIRRRPPRHLDEEVARCTKALLSRTSALDVHARLETVAHQLQTALQPSFDRCHLRIIDVELTRPPLPDLDDLRPLTVVVRDTFATAVHQVRPELEVAVHGRLTGLHRVGAYLERGGVRAALEKTVRDEIEAYLHNLEPEQLFIHLRVPAPATEPPRAHPPANPAPTVETALRARVTEVLKDSFGFVVQTFTLKRGTSLIDTTYEAMVRAPIAFEVEVPVAGHTGLVRFRGALQVVGVAVEDWPLFQRTLPTPEKLAEHAVRALQSRVNEITSGRASKPSERAVIAMAREVIPPALRSMFGVGVAGVGWERLVNDDDAAVTAAERELRDAALAEWVAASRQWMVEKRQLEAQLRALEDDDDPDGVARVQRRLAAHDQRRPTVETAAPAGRALQAGSGEGDRR